MEQLIIVAFIIEALWETIKLVKDRKGINLDKIAVMLLGVLVAILGKLDIFLIAGVEFEGIPFLGNILTGLLLSRGSNFVHDIMGSMGQIYQTQKSVAVTKDVKQKE